MCHGKTCALTNSLACSPLHFRILIAVFVKMMQVYFRRRRRGRRRREEGDGKGLEGEEGGRTEDEKRNMAAKDRKSEKLPPNPP